MRAASQPMPRIRVLCVDDLPDVTAVMRMLIDAEADMECVGRLASANDLVEQVRALKTDVLLLDATIPGEAPFRAMSDLSRACPQTKTIIFSGHDHRAFIDEAMDAGACGVVSKDDSPQAIVQAVRAVAAGNTYFPNAVRTT